jgi:hypothetical protein
VAPRVAFFGPVALALTGCGAGVPLLVPARALPKGVVAAAAGLSGNVPLGSMANDLNVARNEAATSPGIPGDASYAKGALVAAAATPGLAPVVAARVGVGGRWEGGITYTGRAARIDMRRSFDFGAYSFSAGAGLDVPFYGTGVGSELPNVDLSFLHGYGADVPLLFGWQSDAGLYKLWVGARAGFEYDAISALTSESVPSVSATRYYGGGLAGIAAGFRHLHVALEIDFAYQTITGSFNGTEVTVSGLSAAPAGAMWVTF